MIKSASNITKSSGMSGKPVVFVIGASGNVGSATMQSLSSKFASSLDIRAGVRNPDKADALKALPGVTVVQATMGDHAHLEETLRGVDSLFIVTPGIEDRAPVTIATARRAKNAGVKHILVVSVPDSDHPDTILGAQFHEIETNVQELGVPYTFIRLPFFLENYFGMISSIKSESVFYMPFQSDKYFAGIVVQDTGNAAATILANPTKHANKTYQIISNYHNLDTLASAFSAELGRPIKHVRQSYEECEKSKLAIGLGRWIVDGLMQWFRMADSGKTEVQESDLHDYEAITGEKPTTLKDWIHRNKAAFQ